MSRMYYRSIQRRSGEKRGQVKRKVQRKRVCKSVSKPLRGRQMGEREREMGREKWVEGYIEKWAEKPAQHLLENRGEDEEEGNREKPKIQCLNLNDYRPVALTSTIMKCFERLVRSFITSSIPDSLDPLQFAYRPNRSTEDAIALTLHTALSHLDQRDTYVRMLFIDYSSAFNTIVPSKLVTTRAPQGCVLSPLLYSLFTHDCVATHSSNTIGQIC
ncbi:hypothetical protein L3Q82_000212 [Scortum barcoo]|uniref:Uncharacterized protein n=1 Tax=Scortum barcoo TaxID=214431 RepID=A0ACB8XAT4_9TELE|nr:hypothetical protein L3Q82_000212 [Scortum barcoo]